MRYRTLGKTGIKVSILGFGGMGLPTIKLGEDAINHEKAIQNIRKGIDKGINYIDTAYDYHLEESEIVIGKALKNAYREKVTLVTKAPVWKETYNKPEHFEEHINEQLKKLDVETIDIYLFHALNSETWKKVQDLNLIERAQISKKEGKIKHLGFSFHDKPEVLKEIIDSNEFEIMLVQYNILDIVNEEMIKYAAEKGLGVAIMGPVGGGRLAGKPPKEMQKWLTRSRESFVDLALKFVWSNPHVSIALSGMASSEEIINDNLNISLSEHYTLTEKEEKTVKKIAACYKELTDVICTNCRYCMPCPSGVNIPYIFRMLMYLQIYGEKEKSKKHYSMIGEEDWLPGRKADACTECGECEKKCPQKISIIEQLKKAHEVLSK